MEYLVMKPSITGKCMATALTLRMWFKGILKIKSASGFKASFIASAAAAKSGRNEYLIMLNENVCDVPS